MPLYDARLRCSQAKYYPIQIFRKARTRNVLAGTVTDEQLRAIYDLMKFGPTSANCSPARNLDAINWFKGKPAMIESTAFRNSSLQGAYFIVAARAQGLDCGPMSGFDNAKVDAEFFPS